MIFESYPIREHARLVRYGYERSTEIAYHDTRPAVVVCPGGGYWWCSDREADPVAMQFLSEGYHVFILYYSCQENAVFPNSLLDLCEAMRFIRANADEFGVIRDKIAVCGFSAGGHLAASLGVYWNDPEIMALSGCKKGENAPNALILGYPVISTSWIQNDGSLARIIGNADTEKVTKKLNLHTAVTDSCPQTFLCHTVRDNIVPVEDSLKFASALISAGVACELHIFPNGGHGLSLSNGQVCEDGGDESFAMWMPLAKKWLARKWNDPTEAERKIEKAVYSANK